MSNIQKERDVTEKLSFYIKRYYYANKLDEMWVILSGIHSRVSSPFFHFLFLVNRKLHNISNT